MLFPEPFLTWNGVARDLLERCGLDDPPIDTRKIARLWGFELRPVRERYRVSCYGNVIEYQPDHPDWRFDIAHELGHFGLKRCGENPRDERAADYVAGAIVCPDAAMKRDLRRCAWDLSIIQPLYDISWLHLGERMPYVRSCVVTIIDNGEVQQRLQSPWLPRSFGRRPSDFEWEIATAAAERGEHIYAENLLTAYAAPSPERMRVVVVCAADELAVKLNRRGPLDW